MKTSTALTIAFTLPATPNAHIVQLQRQLAKDQADMAAWDAMTPAERQGRARPLSFAVQSYWGEDVLYQHALATEALAVLRAVPADDTRADAARQGARRLAALLDGAWHIAHAERVAWPHLSALHRDRVRRARRARRMDDAQRAWHAQARRDADEYIARILAA